MHLPASISESKTESTEETSASRLPLLVCDNSSDELPLVADVLPLFDLLPLFEELSSVVDVLPLVADVDDAAAISSFFKWSKMDTRYAAVFPEPIILDGYCRVR